MKRCTVVGRGAIGSGLAGLLRGCGVEVEMVPGRKPAHPSGEWVFICTPDRTIGDVSRTIPWTRGQTAIHCSGALPREALQVPDGVDCMVVHPLAAVPDPAVAVARLQSCWYRIDGPPDASSEAARLVQSWGGRILSPVPTHPTLYHAGAVVVSNYLCTLADLGARLLEAAGASREQALQALLPLMQGTLDNLAQHGLPNALTGPIARGDYATVEAHRDALRMHLPEWLPTYDALKARTEEMVSR